MVRTIRSVVPADDFNNVRSTFRYIMVGIGNELSKYYKISPKTLANKYILSNLLDNILSNKLDFEINLYTYNIDTFSSICIDSNLMDFIKIVFFCDTILSWQEIVEAINNNKVQCIRNICVYTYFYT